MGTKPTGGKYDYYAPGDWNAACAFCGRKGKASEMLKLPPGDPLGGGQYVHPEHWRPRQPQDFVRGIPDNMAAPWVQEQTDSFVTDICDLYGRSSVAGYAVAGCSIAGLPLLIDPDFPTDYDWLTDDSDSPLTTDDLLWELFP